MKDAVAIIFQRFGPGHHARVRAAAAARPRRIVGVEVCRNDATCEWELIEGASGFEKVTIFPDLSDRTGVQIARGVFEALGRLDPGVVFVPGWSGPGALGAVQWALARRRPWVLLSDSNAHDFERTPLKEWVKARIVRLASAGFAAGSASAAYLQDLGLASSHIVTNMYAIDNNHFETGSNSERPGACGADEASCDLEPYFFACARFVPKKNLFRLLGSYQRYVAQTGASPWSLVLAGNGPLRADLERTVERLGLGSLVRFPGFLRYDELPRWYGLASAFVHTSTVEQWGMVVNEAMAAGLPILVSARCGCAPDLVEEGRNGWTFDPTDEEALAALLTKLAALPDEERFRMGKASQEIIADWGLDRFADAFWHAADIALGNGPRRPGWLARSLLRALIRRSVHSPRNRTPEGASQPCTTT